MDVQNTITLKLTAILNSSGNIYSYNAGLDSEKKIDANAIQLPIPIKKGEIDNLIAQLGKNTNLDHAKEVVIYVVIQNKTFTDKICKMTPPKTPPPTPWMLTAKTHITDILTEMIQGMRVLVKEVTV
jgi:hypothetical protein